MRKSFDGLGGLIHREMGRDPLSGDVYLFVNRRRDRIKFLVWESDGYWIWYKRLEKGTFRLPDAGVSGDSLRVDQLFMMLWGLEEKARRKRVRYSK